MGEGFSPSDLSANRRFLERANRLAPSLALLMKLVRQEVARLAQAQAEALSGGDLKEALDASAEQSLVLRQGKKMLDAVALDADIAASEIRRISEGEHPSDEKQFLRLASLVQRGGYKKALSYFEGMDTFNRDAIPTPVYDWLYWKAGHDLM